MQGHSELLVGGSHGGQGGVGSFPKREMLEKEKSSVLVQERLIVNRP